MLGIIRCGFVTPLAESSAYGERVAYPPRIEFPGALYHVTSRGVERRSIFRDPVDFETFLGRLDGTVARFEWLLHAYCLMPNHFHFVLETPNANLARGMQGVCAPYAQAFNHRHRRVGHLFQGRYHAVLIKRENHLLEATRYVVLNPVRAGLCAKPDEWAWSSYAATAGLTPPPPFLAVDSVHSQFGSDRAIAERRYAEFVADGAPAASLAGLFARA